MSAALGKVLDPLVNEAVGCALHMDPHAGQVAHWLEARKSDSHGHAMAPLRLPEHYAGPLTTPPRHALVSASGESARLGARSAAARGAGVITAASRLVETVGVGRGYVDNPKPRTVNAAPASEHVVANGLLGSILAGASVVLGLIGGSLLGGLTGMVGVLIGYPLVVSGKSAPGQNYTGLIRDWGEAGFKAGFRLHVALSLPIGIAVSVLRDIGAALKIIGVAAFAVLGATVGGIAGACRNAEGETGQPPSVPH